MAKQTYSSGERTHGLIHRIMKRQQLKLSSVSRWHVLNNRLEYVHHFKINNNNKQINKLSIAHFQRVWPIFHETVIQKYACGSRAR